MAKDVSLRRACALAMSVMTGAALAGDGAVGFPNDVMLLPIKCPEQADVAVSASTFGELFAKDWRPQVEAESDAEVQWVHITAAAPRHPRSLRAIKEGTVKVAVLVAADARVVDAKVVCSTDARLDAAALAAANASVFKAARVRGIPVMSFVTIPYEF